MRFHTRNIFHQFRSVRNFPFDLSNLYKPRYFDCACVWVDFEFRFWARTRFSLPRTILWINVTQRNHFNSTHFNKYIVAMSLVRSYVCSFARSCHFIRQRHRDIPHHVAFVAIKYIDWPIITVSYIVLQSGLIVVSLVQSSSFSFRWFYFPFYCCTYRRRHYIGSLRTKIRLIKLKVIFELLL